MKGTILCWKKIKENTDYGHNQCQNGWIASMYVLHEPLLPLLWRQIPLETEVTDSAACLTRFPLIIAGVSLLSCLS